LLHPSGLPRVWGPYPDKAYRWNRKITPVNGAFFDIWAFVIKLLAGFWLNGKSWSYPGGVTEAHKIARRKQQAVWIRSTLLFRPNLHQNWAVVLPRADLFPSEYVEELAKLQDKVCL